MCVRLPGSHNLKPTAFLFERDFIIFIFLASINTYASTVVVSVIALQTLKSTIKIFVSQSPFLFVLTFIFSKNLP